LVSRRRLFGLLGGAAAAGAGLAVAGSTLGAEPADATTGPMMFGLPNDAGGATTSLTSSTPGETLLLTNTDSTGLGDALFAQVTGAGGPTIVATNSGGAAAYTGNNNGATPTMSLQNGSSVGGPCLELHLGQVAGTPTSGAHNAGQLYVDSGGVLFFCVGTGTPGTWTDLSSGQRLVTLGTPARVYDSRNGQQPSTGPKSQITGGSTVSIDVTGAKAGGGNSGVPSGATAVLGNITMINGPNTTFLTVFAAGATPPATSNINALGGQVIANNFTSQIGSGVTNSNKISIQCGFGPTDFIIDIFGYYP
jgi:hypothetical protein